MKQRIFLTTLMLIAGLFLSRITAQKLFLWKTDGTQVPFDLSILKTVKFSEGNLLVNFTSGSTESHSLSTLIKLSFDNSTSVESGIINKNTNKVYIYYNGTENRIYLKNILKNNSPVIVFRINGIMVMRAQVSTGDQSIDVSNLSSGFYLLNINNQVFKFIK